MADIEAPWAFFVTPARTGGHIYATDGTTSVDISPDTVDGSFFTTGSFTSGTSVSLEFYDDDYPDISFIPQTATVGSTSAVNFLPTVMYAWSSDSSGTYPSTLYIWTTDVTADLTDIPYWANYQNGTADDVTTTIIDGNPIWTGTDEFEVDGVIYIRDSSKDVVTTTQTVANLSDGTNTYEIEDSQARADIQEIQSNYITTDTAQTISGEKTFSSDPIVTARSILMKSQTTKGTPPSATEYTAINVVDNSGTDAVNRLGNLEFYTSADGSTRAVLRAYKNESGVATNGAIYVQVASNGTVTTNAPAVTNTNGIVTQTALTKATNGYLKLGNGIIIQWGDHNTTSAGASTITFPTAFTANSYSIVMTRVSGTSATNESGSYYFRGRTTTSVGVYKTSNNTQAMMWIAVGY